MLWSNICHVVLLYFPMPYLTVEMLIYPNPGIVDFVDESPMLFSKDKRVFLLSRRLCLKGDVPLLEKQFTDKIVRTS